MIFFPQHSSVQSQYVTSLLRHRKRWEPGGGPPSSEAKTYSWMQKFLPFHCLPGAQVPQQFLYLVAFPIARSLIVVSFGLCSRPDKCILFSKHLVWIDTPGTMRQCRMLVFFPLFSFPLFSSPFPFPLSFPLLLHNSWFLAAEVIPDKMF